MRRGHKDICRAGLANAGARLQVVDKRRLRRVACQDQLGAERSGEPRAPPRGALRRHRVEHGAGWRHGGRGQAARRRGQHARVDKACRHPSLGAHRRQEGDRHQHFLLVQALFQRDEQAHHHRSARAQRHQDAPGLLREDVIIFDNQEKLLCC